MKTTKTNFCAAVSDSLSVALSALKEELGEKHLLSNAELLAVLTEKYAAQKAEISALKKKTEGAINPFRSELTVSQMIENYVIAALKQADKPINQYGATLHLRTEKGDKTYSPSKPTINGVLELYAAEIAAHKAANPHLYK
jgi:hypothetical protein